MDTVTQTTEAIMATYQKLPQEERDEIDRLAQLLEDWIHQRNPNQKGFGRKSSLELLGKLGMLLDRSGLTPVAADASTRG